MLSLDEFVNMGHYLAILDSMCNFEQLGDFQVCLVV